MEWTARLAAAPQPLTLGVLWQRFTGIFDWEMMITLFLALGAVVAVSAPLEDGGWRRNMPPITTVSVIAVLTGMLLARSRMSALLAWPLGILMGAGVVAWQTLAMASPGTPADRITIVHDRFATWLNVVNSSQVTNDPLPFNVLIISLTWLGVMMFAWSVYRWHNAWLGLIPGGAALFLDLTLVGDNLTGAIILYMLFGFLLVMQTNLLAMVRQWRHENTPYPPMINLTFLHFSAWALVILILASWLIPAGLKTPGPIQSLAEDSLQFASRYVRLAGPLQSNKVIPIHSYSGTLPFQGSINLGERDLMTVTVENPQITGSLLLRGATYDEYQSGGWQTGARATVDMPTDRTGALSDLLAEQPSRGTLVPLHIEMEARTVAGTVVYVPGVPVATDRSIQVQVPKESILTRYVNVPGSRGLDVQQVLATTIQPDELGVGVLRDNDGRVTAIQFVKLNNLNLLGDASLLDPGGRIKRHESYSVTGFIPETTPEMLSAASLDYPDWVRDTYRQLPDTVTQRVRDLAADWAGSADTPYEKAMAIQDHLRNEYPYQTKIPETPPGVDNVDYFLFTLGQGYFDYHASAMVVMLRSLGVPARLAVGFAVDDNDRDGSGAYVVKDKNSYAWPEVYFPNIGWVPFNPTPDKDSDLTPRTDVTAPAAGTDHNPIEDVPAAVNGNAPAAGGQLDDPLAGQPLAGTPTGSGQQPLKWYVSAAVTAFIAALIGTIMLGWNRSVAGLPYPQQVWAKTVRLAGWGGLRPQPGQTPHEYAQRLGKRFFDVREDMPVLADAYVKSRYGRKELSEEEIAALNDAWPEVRATLVGGITGRFFRRRRKDD